MNGVITTIEQVARDFFDLMQSDSFDSKVANMFV